MNELERQFLLAVYNRVGDTRERFHVSDIVPDIGTTFRDASEICDQLRIEGFIETTPYGNRLTGDGLAVANKIAKQQPTGQPIIPSKPTNQSTTVFAIGSEPQFEGLESLGTGMGKELNKDEKEKLAQIVPNRPMKDQTANAILSPEPVAPNRIEKRREASVATIPGMDELLTSISEAQRIISTLHYGTANWGILSNVALEHGYRPCSTGEDHEEYVNGVRSHISKRFRDECFRKALEIVRNNHNVEPPPPPSGDAEVDLQALMRWGYIVERAARATAFAPQPPPPSPSHIFNIARVDQLTGHGNITSVGRDQIISNGNGNAAGGDTTTTFEKKSEGEKKPGWWTQKLVAWILGIAATIITALFGWWLKHK